MAAVTARSAVLKGAKEDAVFSGSKGGGGGDETPAADAAQRAAGRVSGRRVRASMLCVSEKLGARVQSVSNAADTRGIR
jgi:hypothetical protein